MGKEKKIVRIAKAYGIEKKWGYIASVAEKLDTAAATVSSWKTRGVPDDVLARVVRETGASFQYLDTGEGELFPVDGGDGEFNGELMKEIIAFIEEERQRLDIDYHPDKLGKALVLIYKECVREGRVDVDRIGELIQLVAK